MYDSFGIKNYCPVALTEAVAIVKAYQDLKPHLQGQPLSGIWAVWPDDMTEPCECTPIVLQFGSFRHEICWEKTDDLALSANTIDVKRGFNRYGSEESPSHWEKNALPDFQLLVGQTLLSLDLVEAAVNYSPDKGAKQLWVSNGILFMFERNTLEVYNTLDCTNMKQDMSTGDEYRRVNI